jgi:hypothetical protein
MDTNKKLTNNNENIEKKIISIISNENSDRIFFVNESSSLPFFFNLLSKKHQPLDLHFLANSATLS